MIDEREGAVQITKQRSYTSNVRLSMLGMVSLGVDVVPVRRTASSKDGEFKLVSPDGAPVRQVYVSDDDSDEKQYLRHELKRGRFDGDDLVLASDEEILAAKVGDMQPNQIELSTHATDDVADQVRPGEKQYRLRPSKGGRKVIAQPDADLYLAIRELVSARPELTFMGALRLRDTRSVYRLEVWDGQLLLCEVVTEDDLAERDVITGDPGERQVAAMSQLAEMSVTDWDPAVHRWDVRLAVAELMSAKASGVEAPALKRVEVAPENDLMAMLNAAIEAKKKEKEMADA